MPRVQEPYVGLFTGSYIYNVQLKAETKCVVTARFDCVLQNDDLVVYTRIRTLTITPFCIGVTGVFIHINQGPEKVSVCSSMKDLA